MYQSIVSLVTGRVPTPRLKKLLEELPPWERYEFVLCGSAALAFRGVRDVQDLDVIVRPALWEKLDRTFADYDNYDTSHARKLRDRDIDVFGEVPRIRSSFEEVYSRADEFDGYRVMCLRQVLAIKALVPERREKDMNDMIALARLIKNENPIEKFFRTPSAYR